MREGSGYGEWNQPRGLITAGITLAASLLLLGTLIARLLGPPAPAAADTPVPGAELPGAPVATEIGSAAVEYAGPLSAASDDHIGVVRLSTTTCGERRSGSGVVVADGLVLTAAHVVGDAELVRVDVGTATATGEVLGVAIDGRDLALIEVDIVPPAPVRASTALREGEAVTLIGHPEGGPQVQVVGPHVSAPPEVAAVAPAAAIAVEAEILVGMSGGPAIDPIGALVGVVSGHEVLTGTTFVVPVELATDTLAETMVDGSCPASA